ncbi:unnamed protein product [Caenorhabditis angaria]|uniref:Uncharacterized protein n=1 Tax=Caenorhabditis angaria TaxID=860376 RepID=A0A9P1IKM1_9PELO|nr:unnamed protein product [Caenorhabditis angaria]
MINFLLFLQISLIFANDVFNNNIIEFLQTIKKSKDPGYFDNNFKFLDCSKTELDSQGYLENLVDSMSSEILESVRIPSAHRLHQGSNLHSYYNITVKSLNFVPNFKFKIHIDKSFLETIKLISGERIGC